MQNIISVRNLSKTFVIPHEKKNTLKEHFTGLFKRSSNETFNALDNISFEVQKGECIGIMGKNGSGKSTLLKLLAGIYTPSKGLVQVKAKISPFLELGVGFDPELSGKENIYLNASVLGMSRKEINKRYNEIVGFAELERFIDMKVKNYSSGMFVRLAFAVAIQVDADVFLMDEVLAVGDANFQEKCFRIFHEFKKQGKTIILVSHDTASIARFCDRSILLEKGKIIADDMTQAVIDKYIYEQGELVDGLIQSEKDHSIPTVNKKIYFDSYKLIDKNNKESSTFCTGDDLKIEVTFESQDKSIQHINAGIAIYDENGNHLFGDRSEWHKVLIDVQKGRYELVINDLPLLSGNYFITLALDSEGDSEQYDWLDKKICFNVQNSGIKDGKINFKTQWGAK